MTTNNKPPLLRLALKRVDTTNHQPTRENVIACAARINAILTKLTTNNSGFTAFAYNEATLDQLLTSKAEKAFKAINLKATLPPELKAKRTVFIKNVDRSILAQTPVQIITQLKTQNLHCTEAIKVGATLLKIVLSTTTEARRVRASGLQLCNLLISPHDCEEEIFTPLLICYKCYAFEHHITKNCTQTYNLCSECGDRDHNYTNCPGTAPKSCANCKRANKAHTHRTLAASCPIRKLALKIKKDKQQQPPLITNTPNTTTQPTALSTQTIAHDKPTYAGMVQRTNASIPPPAVNNATPQATYLKINDHTHKKMLALILEAHVANLGNGGKDFGKTLSDSLQREYGIHTNFPNRNTEEILRICMTGSEPSQTDFPQPHPTTSKTPTKKTPKTRNSTANFQTTSSPTSSFPSIPTSLPSTSHVAVDWAPKTKTSTKSPTSTSTKPAALLKALLKTPTPTKGAQKNAVASPRPTSPTLTKTPNKSTPPTPSKNSKPTELNKSNHSTPTKTPTKPIQVATPVLATPNSRKRKSEKDLSPLLSTQDQPLARPDPTYELFADKGAIILAMHPGDNNPSLLDMFNKPNNYSLFYPEHNEPPILKIATYGCSIEETIRLLTYSESITLSQVTLLTSAEFLNTHNRTEKTRKKAKDTTSLD